MEDLRPSGTEDSDEAPAQGRIRSHDEYSVRIHAVVISSHVYMYGNMVSHLLLTTQQHKHTHTHTHMLAPSLLISCEHTQEKTQVCLFVEAV